MAGLDFEEEDSDQTTCPELRNQNETSNTRKPSPQKRRATRKARRTVGLGAAAELLPSFRDAFSATSVQKSLASLDLTSQQVTKLAIPEQFSEIFRKSNAVSSLCRSISAPDLSKVLRTDSPNSNFQVSLSCALSLTNINSKMESFPERERNFKVVGSGGGVVTGLTNIGNNCYMNSIMQCLFHTSDLARYLVHDSYQNDCRRLGKIRGQVSVEVAAALKEMDKGHSSIALYDLKRIVGRLNSDFCEPTEQDAHEFLIILMDSMHEELNRARTKYSNSLSNTGLEDVLAGTIFWDRYLECNNSKITHLFSGEQRSVIRCTFCGYKSVSFESFYVLSLPIPAEEKMYTLKDCLDLYTTKEVVSGWRCENCEHDGGATKKIDLWRLPPYLIIQLQRFSYDGWWQKRTTTIEFPLNDLDLTRNEKGFRKACTTDQKRQQPIFHLYAVSNHFGRSTNGGHYTSFCRFDNDWFEYNDHMVSSLSTMAVCSSSAYILFYRNRNSFLQ